MDCKYELKKAQKRIENLQKQLAAESEKADGYKQLLDANNAIIAAVVESVGGEVKLKQEAINAALSNGLRIFSSYDATGKVHTLTVSKEKAGG